MGLRWRTEVRQQVFEEAAADCGEALTAFSDSRKGKWAGRPAVGFPRFKRKRLTTPSFRLRSIASKSGRPSVRVGDGKPRSVRSRGKNLPGGAMTRVHKRTGRDWTGSGRQKCRLTLIGSPRDVKQGDVSTWCHVDKVVLDSPPG